MIKGFRNHGRSSSSLYITHTFIFHSTGLTMSFSIASLSYTLFTCVRRVGFIRSTRIFLLRYQIWTDCALELLIICQVWHRKGNVDDVVGCLDFRKFSGPDIFRILLRD